MWRPGVSWLWCGTFSASCLGLTPDLVPGQSADPEGVEASAREPTAAGGDIVAAALRAHTGFLAHDLLEGRGPGTRGEALAALYLTTRLRELGLEPLPSRDPDYRLRVPLTAHSFDEDRMQLTILTSNEKRSVHPPDLYHAGGGPDAFRDFGGELLFAGSTPGARAALDTHPDLTGRVIVVGPPWEGLGDLVSTIEDRGAAGLVAGVPSDFYDRLRVVRGPMRYSLPAEVDDPDNQSNLPEIVVGPEGIRALGLEEELRPGRVLGTARHLGVRVEVELHTRSDPVSGHNVAALVPGTDPARVDEAILFVAHYDHVGFGQAMDGDSIWNGFRDNAAGVAMLLEMARVLVADPLPHPAVFLFTTAEEQGLLGATWFVHRGTYSTEDILAVINLDGGIPPEDVEGWVLAAVEGTGLAETADAALRDDGWEVEPRPLIPDSDHWAFHRVGISALFLYPAEQAGEPRAHTPDDEWSPTFRFGGLALYAEAALTIARAITR